MDEVYSKKILTIPNLLSFFRLILIIPIVLSYVVYDESIITFALVVISGGSDVIDGFIARKFNMRSELGRFLDPLADKLTQLAVMICLCSKYIIIIIPCIVLVIKEIVSGIIGLKVVNKLKHMLDSKWHGKAATVSLYLLASIHLLWKDIPEYVTIISVIICTTLVLLSFILYLIRYYKISKELKNTNENEA